MGDADYQYPGWLRLLQFLLGLGLALGLIGAGGAGLFFLLMGIGHLLPPPPKPLFANEAQSDSPVPAVSFQPLPMPLGLSAPTASPTASPQPPGSYLARVTWPAGLAVRAEPTSRAAIVGGLDWHARVLVLDGSPDRGWVKVQLLGSKRQGWIKAGNVEKMPPRTSD